MTVTLSPPVRIAAILGGVAALGLAAFMLTLGRPSSGREASVAPIKPLHPVRKLGTHGTVQEPVARPRSTPKAMTAVKAKPAPAAVELLPGLPPQLARSLRRHELVVVTVFDPQARVDHIPLAEASAAAKLVGAGFVALNVLEQPQAGPLVRQLGVLPDPAVLVYRRPGRLVARFDGFADRDTVAQAVVNAAAETP